MSEEKLYGSTLVKAKEILDFLGSQRDPQTLAAISAGLNMNKPTVRKILDTLSIIDWVAGDSEQGFKISLGMLKYGERAKEMTSVEQVVEPFLRDLSERFGETVNFAVPGDNQVVLLSKYEGTHSVSLKSKIGQGLPLYTTSMGKAILATYSLAEFESYVTNNSLTAKTLTTITDPMVLRQEIATVQKEQIAYEHGENETDISCVGTSLSVNGKLVGAFSISVPSYRFDDVREKEFATAVRETKIAIMRELER